MFEQLKNLDVKEFFNKSYKILQEAAIYKETGYIDQEWKERNARMLCQNSSCYDLLKAFEQTKNDVYFSERSFYSELLRYYKNQIKEVKRIPS